MLLIALGVPLDALGCLRVPSGRDLDASCPHRIFFCAVDPIGERDLQMQAAILVLMPWSSVKLKRHKNLAPLADQYKNIIASIRCLRL